MDRHVAAPRCTRHRSAVVGAQPTHLRRQQRQASRSIQVVLVSSEHTGGEGAKAIDRSNELGEVGVLDDDGDGTEALSRSLLPSWRASIGASRTAAGAHQPSTDASTSSTTRAPANLNSIGCRSCDCRGQHHRVRHAKVTRGLVRQLLDGVARPQADTKRGDPDSLEPRNVSLPPDPAGRKDQTRGQQQLAARDIHAGSTSSEMCTAVTGVSGTTNPSTGCRSFPNARHKLATVGSATPPHPFVASDTVCREKSRGQLPKGVEPTCVVSSLEN